ncbi:MAG: alanine racemase [Spirochaetales bacterium]|nr:alanine racemase [Spirochaetales bacterium]
MIPNYAPPEIASDNIPSPSLIFFQDVIRRNIAHAIEMAGETSRLRPHVKSHKCPQIVQMKIDAGITKFKCATLSEARMLAQAGAGDILLAYQPVGPNIPTLLELIETFPDSHFSTTVDHPRILAELDRAASKRRISIPLFIDIDVGMTRTGVHSIEKAVDLALQIKKASGVKFQGLHVYDGHHNDPDPAVRKKQAAETIDAIDALRSGLAAESIEVDETVIGGTPMFSFYLDSTDFTLSPGTLFLHDYTTYKNCPELRFEFGAMVLSRVISLPEKGCFTLDAGAKALSMDYAEKAKLISRFEAQPGPMSEEHWRFSCEPGSEPELGEVMLLIPGHVCTTVHHYDKAYVIAGDGTVTDTWPIAARGRI